MNDAQRECFTVFCRNLQNGIGLIHGPGGTGKTVMVAALAESAAELGRKVRIVTSQNSAADSAIEKLQESKYIVVRAHALGLKRRSMLQSQATASKAEDHNEDEVQETNDQEVNDTKAQVASEDHNEEAIQETNDQAVDDTKAQVTSEKPPKKKPGFFAKRFFHFSRASVHRKTNGPQIPSGNPADIPTQSSDSAPEQDTNVNATPKASSQVQTDVAVPAHETSLDATPKELSQEETDNAVPDPETNIDATPKQISQEQIDHVVPDPDINLDATSKDLFQEQTDDALPDQETDLDEALDIQMIDIMMRVNVDFMRSCENTDLAKDSVLRPVDQRVQKIQFAIHTWMLKLAGIVPSKWSQQPTQEQVATGVRDEWVEFRALWSKQKVTRLEAKEWEGFKKSFSRLATEVLQRAHIIACTPATVSSELLKPVNFNDVINDETSVTTMLELLSAWRSIENLVLIGDDFQLKPPVFTGPAENPFHRTIEYSPFARFRDLHMPAFLLNEQMRMPLGMMHLSNDMIYNGKIKDGKGTALHENTEATSFKAYLRKIYPSVAPEPEHLIYPVMLNIHGESAIEGKGTSIYNAYNIATTIDEIIKLLQQHPAATSSNVAIAAPYRAQIREYRRALKKADERFPDLSLTHIRIGIASY